MSERPDRATQGSMKQPQDRREPDWVADPIDTKTGVPTEPSDGLGGWALWSRRISWPRVVLALLLALVLAGVLSWGIATVQAGSSGWGPSTWGHTWPGGIQVLVNGRQIEVSQLGEVWAGLATSHQWIVGIVALAVLLLLFSITLLIVPLLVLGLLVLVILFVLGGASVPSLFLIGALLMLLLVLSPVLLALWMVFKLVSLLLLRPLRWVWGRLIGAIRHPRAAI
jgi:hypothetical protein